MKAESKLYGLTLLVCLIIGSISGCTWFGTIGHNNCNGVSSLEGAYVFTVQGRPTNSDSIYLHNSGRYEHFLKTSKGDVLKEEGGWEYDQERCSVRLENFGFRGDDVHGGYWNSRVEGVDGEIRLIYASEEGQYYLRSGN